MTRKVVMQDHPVYLLLRDAHWDHLMWRLRNNPLSSLSVLTLSA